MTSPLHSVHLINLQLKPGTSEAAVVWYSAECAHAVPPLDYDLVLQ